MPAAQLSASAPQWEALDQYVAQKAYLAVYGYLSTPQFYLEQDRLRRQLVFNPLYGNDFSSLQLK